ncbi:hypothetical protein WA026_017960 [Henosepilachna vigintioctopunctata]|uniref:Farnesyl pyrophosphate synthase n=1 Tax=Henosepilachna vigintioctopunctata TaxID=420089 RepID=A0AAW1TNX8_9CUCU
MAHLPKIVADACHKDAILDYQPINERLRKLLNYYGPHGKFLRQHVLIYVYKKIEQHYGTFDEKKMDQVYNLGWCLEMLNIQFMIIDDLLDNHEIRRGRKAWYKLDNVGLSVIMDSYLLQTSMFHLLKKYFSSHPCYSKILENFARLEFTVALLLELYSKNFEDFTTERYNGIAQTKCTYYILGQPLQLATLLSNKGFHMNDMMQKVFEHFGFLYTMQNDILDCYGEEFGAKPGTDIQERRCTVLILAALRKASPGQRKLLDECYGVKDDEKIRKVKQIYEELDVLGECYKLEKKLYDRIRTDMKNIPDDFTRSIMENLSYVYTFGEIGKPLR